MIPHLSTAVWDVSLTIWLLVGYFRQLPADVDPGIRAEADAIAAQSTSQAKVPSLLPVGLRDKAGAYDDVFRTTFTGIVLRRRDIGEVLAGKAKELQEVFDSAKAPCWRPDPARWRRTDPAPDCGMRSAPTTIRST